MSYLLVALFVTLGWLVYFYLKNYVRAVYLALKVPGPPALPILGNVLLLTESKKLEAMGNKMTEIYGPIIRVWISVIPIFLVVEPQHLQLILGSSRSVTKNMFYSALTNFIGDGLITNSGDKWRLHRKLIQPCFRANILELFFNSFYDCSMIAVKSLEGETDVNVIHLANKFALDVLQDTVLGIPAEDLKSAPYRGRKMVVPSRITRPWLLLDFVFKITNTSKDEEQEKQVLQNYTRAILKQKRESTEKTCNNKVNLMDMLIEIASNNPEFTDSDIINETSTFMLAGQESVSTALAFSLFFLSKHQDIQNKVVEELKQIFEGSDRKITYEDVAEMKYLEQCIKETLRLCPSIPIFARKLTEDVNLGKLGVLPKGSNIIISPYATHRIPYIYTDPSKYDPDRFSPERQTKLHPYAFIPFSTGPRNCIGSKFALIELKTIISEILRRYHLSLSPGHEEFDLVYRIPTLRARGGIWIRLTKRN